MDSAFIHQVANELVQNVGTRNIKQIARSCSDYSVAPEAPVRNFEQQLSDKNSSALR